MVKSYVRRPVPGSAFVISSLSGLLFGGAFGARLWSSAWPELSRTAVLRSAAVGWLIGIFLSPFLAWLLIRLRPIDRLAAPPRGRRLLNFSLFLLTLAPFGLWAIAFPPQEIRSQFSSRRAASDLRPNIILISIDALRADHVGAYGSARHLTPNLDTFAKEASKYESAVAASSWTLTSLGAVFTARPPSQCGLKIPVPESHAWYKEFAGLTRTTPLLSELLHKQGYTTAAELANIYLAADRGWQRGFTSFRNEGRKKDIYAESTRAQWVTKHALSWLRLNRREPFFLWVHYLDPHVPYDAPNRPASLLRAKYPAEWQTKRKYWYNKISARDEAEKTRYQEFCRAMYAEEVRYADLWVGRLLAQLKRRQLYDDALIIITADHGEELFDHGDFEHGHSMHYELLHVPLLVKWPKGMSADKVISRTVALVDLSGTLLEFSESPAGKSWSALPRQNAARREEAYAEGLLYGKEQTALTTDDYKIIYHPYETRPEAQFEVYDRRNDPLEQNNLAGNDIALTERARLKSLTETARVNARHWLPENDQTSRRSKLSEEVKKELSALGYLGD